MNNSNDSRRSFLKGCLTLGASALLLPALKGKQIISSAFAEGKLVPLTEDDPMAKSLGYYKNAAKVDTKKWPKRAGLDGKTQFCDNCMFYTTIDKKQGKCQIFAGKTVEAKAWCNTWAKKVA